jgi:hypothetical protein
MNSNRPEVAKAVLIVVAQREGRHADVCSRAVTVEANATSVVEGRGRNATAGGRRTYDITHSAGWKRTAAGATHGTKQRSPQLQKVGGGMQRRGRNQMIVRRSARRDRAAVTYRQRYANTKTRSVSPHRKWRSRNMAREGRNTATDYLEGWDPTLTCWQLLRRITEGLASNTDVAVSAAGSARPMTWCDVDPMAVTPISSRPARADLCGVFTR